MLLLRQVHTAYLATRRPVLTQSTYPGTGYAVSGTGLVYHATPYPVLTAGMVLPDPEQELSAAKTEQDFHSGIRLRASYAMSGTGQAKGRARY
eukprot:668585-Rhodomonas_salina.1